MTHGDKRIVIDTDAGVDDALAIVFAMRSPELQVEAITTVSGNVHVDFCTENVFRILDILQPARMPIVAKGEAVPLVRPPVVAPEVHGHDGLGGLHTLMGETGSLKYPRPDVSPISTPAVELLPQIAGDDPGEITLVTIGPLTNVAKAIISDPERMGKYKQIFVMGGAFRAYGNTTTVSEFNIFVDPHSAQVVVESGIPLVFVPLDVTEQVCLEMGHIAQEVEPLGTRLSEFLVDLTQGYIEYHMETEGFSGCYLHDPLAVGVALDESFARMQEGHVEVETEGRVTAGMTVCDLRPNPVTPMASERPRLRRSRRSPVHPLLPRPNQGVALECGPRPPGEGLGVRAALQRRNIDLTSAKLHRNLHRVNWHQ